MGTLRTSICHVVVLSALSMTASTWTVSFDPAEPVSTNGWNLGTTTPQTTRSSTQPGGRKFEPAQGATAMIESPLLTADIRSVAWSAWGNSLNAASKVEVQGRADATSPYMTLFSRTGLSNKLVENKPQDTFTIPEGTVCRQLRIDYTKDAGTWILAEVTITDDAIRAAPPVDFRTETLDADQRRVRVSWDMPDGVTDSIWRTFTTVPAGGISASSPLWRAPFTAVPAAAKTQKLDAAALADLGFAEWDAANVRQPPVAGALLIGWDSHASGTLTTPPLGMEIEAGSTLAVRAATRDTDSGIMPLYIVSGGTTSCLADVAIKRAPQTYTVPLPGLAASDRILLHSCTNKASEQTFIHDLALCAPGTYVPEYDLTNACSKPVPLTGNAVELTVPDDGTRLLLEVCTTHADKTSDWSKPFVVTLPDPETGGGEGDENPTPNPSDLATPTRIRAGLLPDGTVRIGWESPDGATNVRLRVWSCTPSGGLAETAAPNVLWRETFASAPATNSSIALSTEDKWELYSDLGTNGWAWTNCPAIYLAPEAGTLQVGKTDGVGTLTTRALGFSGDGLTLVATARRRSTSSGTDLRAALVSQTGKTNWTGSVTVGDAFAECAVPLGAPLAVGDTLVLSSPTNKSDRRILLSDVALVRDYTPVSFSTNELLVADMGAHTVYDLPPGTDDGPCFLALLAEGPDGRTSTWTAPFALDPAILRPWRDRHVALRGGSATATLAPALPVSAGGLDVSETPFLFLLDGEEVDTVPCRDVSKQLSIGIYVCTNVFEKDWIALVPGSPKSTTEVRDAEVRLSVSTGTFTAQRIEITGVFAQLATANRMEKSLSLQWRVIAPNGRPGDWTDCGRFQSTYTAADTQPDLSGTVVRVTGTADLQAPAGATVETRILCLKGKDSGREAPLGFRDLTVRVWGQSGNFWIVVR